MGVSKCGSPELSHATEPEIYSRECERVTARFNEAIEMAESAFMEELGQLISHLQERLSGKAMEAENLSRPR